MQQSFGTNDLEKKKTLVAMLAKMALIDGFNEIELEFIRNIGRFLKLDGITVDQTITHAKTHSYELPDTEADRLTFFFHIIALMKIDRDVHAEERENAKKLGFELGLRPAMVEELLQVAEANMHTVIPDHEIPNIVGKYLN